MSTDTTTVSQSEDLYYGCVPYDKSNTVVVDGGYPAVVDYTITDSNGNPVDLSAWFDENNPGGEDDPNGLFVNFCLADFTYTCKKPVPASVLDAKNGKIQFTLPEFIFGFPCIYRFWSAVAKKEDFEASGSALFVAPNQGVLVVEWTPFMMHYKKCPVPHAVVPSLRDIRYFLDDFASKNDLLNQVEYSADDIAYALIRPVMQFRDNPLVVRHYSLYTTVATFPWYDPWMRATCAELINVSVKHYGRNKLQSSHGGITGDEKNRDKTYLAWANQLSAEYRQWMSGTINYLHANLWPAWGSQRTIYSIWNRYSAMWNRGW